MYDQSYYDALARLPEPQVHYVVSLSSGAASAVAAERALARWGHDTVSLVFMDTRWEDEDNYRFLDAVAARWKMPVMRLVEGRTPLEVAADQHIIPNSNIAPCTFRLKIELFTRYLESLRSEYDVVVVVLGLNWSETHRMEAPRRNYGARGYLVEYPLMWKPYCFSPLDEIRAWNIAPPRMYAQGYSHANCGGRCVKQGMADWLRTKTHYPDRFAEVAAWEARMRQQIPEYAILRTRVGGMTAPLPLSELVARRETAQLSLFEPSGEDTATCLCNASDPGQELAA